MAATFEQWAGSVKRQMTELGMSALEAIEAVEDNEPWFRDQYDLAAGTGITADEWYTLHHNQDS